MLNPKKRTSVTSVLAFMGPIWNNASLISQSENGLHRLVFVSAEMDLGKRSKGSSGQVVVSLLYRFLTKSVAGDRILGIMIVSDQSETMLQVQ